MNAKLQQYNCNTMQNYKNLLLLLKGGANRRCMKLHNNGLIPILRLEGSTDRSAPRQAVIMRRTDGTVFGLVVDALAEVPEVADSDIRALGAGEMARDGLASHIVPGARRGDGRTGMLLVLDVDRIAEPVRAFARSA